MRPELLFVSPRFLFPADSGGKIRTTQILRGLTGGAFKVRLLMPSTAVQRAKHRFDIDMCCDDLVTWTPAERPEIFKKIVKIGKLFGSLPVPVATDWDAEGARVIERELRMAPDVVVFDFPHSVVLAPTQWISKSVIFTHNVEAEIFERHWKVAASPLHEMIWRSQYRKMLAFEKQALSRFDSIVAVSRRDADFFAAEYGVGPCRTIPTGVDTEFFDYRHPEGAAQVVFCGSMDWMANIDGIEYFFDEIWPSIRKRMPRARMKVIGRTPPETLVRKIGGSAGDWEFTGFVDDVRPHMSGADVFVIPLRVGGGTRIKAFEAMAMGSPVVSTSIGIEGLAVEDGRHFLLADTPETFADRVVSLLSDPQLSRSISEAGRDLVEGSFGYRVAAAEFEKICMDTLNSNR